MTASHQECLKACRGKLFCVKKFPPAPPSKNSIYLAWGLPLAAEAPSEHNIKVFGAMYKDGPFQWVVYLIRIAQADGKNLTWESWRYAGRNFLQKVPRRPLQKLPSISFRRLASLTVQGQGGRLASFRHPLPPRGNGCKPLGVFGEGSGEALFAKRASPVTLPKTHELCNQL